MSVQCKQLLTWALKSLLHQSTWELLRLNINDAYWQLCVFLFERNATLVYLVANAGRGFSDYLQYFSRND